MGVGIVVIGVLAGLLSASVAVFLDVGVVVVALGYVLGGLAGSLMFARMVFLRGETGLR